jgi:hypothetical protein
VFVERFAQQLAVHAHFPRERVGRLLQALAGLAKPVVDQVAEQVFEFAQRHLFAAAEQHVELPTTLTRLAERGEDAVRGEGAVVDALMSSAPTAGAGDASAR